jgi:hypothetical protein
MTEKTGKTNVTGKTGETKRKRLSKGQRTHNRRVKSEARKAITTTHS